MTEIYRNDLIYSISYALDYVEHDLVAIAPHHSRRVAHLSALMGRTLGFATEPLLNLAACAALHDKGGGKIPGSHHVDIVFLAVYRSHHFGISAVEILVQKM